MEKFKALSNEEMLIKSMIHTIMETLKKQHPKLKKVDSNLFHFIIYRVAKKDNLEISSGWFKHGPYCPVVDDVLVEMGMDKAQHQMYGDEEIMEKCIECDCHDG